MEECNNSKNQRTYNHNNRSFDPNFIKQCFKGIKNIFQASFDALNRYKNQNNDKCNNPT